MKVAIAKLRDDWADRWIDYCEQNGIEYKLVIPTDDNIIEQVADCDAFLWHFAMEFYPEVIMAKELLFALQQSGKKVFPNFNTVWYFDDKLGQKYLLEVLDIPAVRAYLFYSREAAVKWAEQTSFPKVFKLRGGAGSTNVMLVKSRSEAEKIIKKSFSKGFAYFNKRNYFKDKSRKFFSGKDNKGLIKGVYRMLFPPKEMKYLKRERAYVYFQDFAPNNDFDIRVIAVGNKAFGIKRMNREGDFRASGSGNIIYDKNQIDIRCVKMVFDVNKKIQAQCLALDIIFDEDNAPKIIEIGYGFVMKGYDACEGYWDSDLNWHDEPVNPQRWIIENLVEEIKSES